MIIYLFKQMLVVFRNPKDTATSYYHFCNKNPLLPNASSWDDFFQKFMNGEGMLSLFIYKIYRLPSYHKVILGGLQ